MMPRMCRRNITTIATAILFLAPLAAMAQYFHPPDRWPRTIDREMFEGFETIDQAGVAAAEFTWEMASRASYRNDGRPQVEFGGVIYRASDGTFGFVTPIHNNDPWAVDAFDQTADDIGLYTANGEPVVATFHIHPSGGPADDVPSSADVRLGVQEGTVSYARTPNGLFRIDTEGVSSSIDPSENRPNEERLRRRPFECVMSGVRGGACTEKVGRHGQVAPLNKPLASKPEGPGIGGNVKEAGKLLAAQPALQPNRGLQSQDCQGPLMSAPSPVASLPKSSRDKIPPSINQCLSDAMEKITSAYQVLENAKCVYEQGLEVRTRLYVAAGFPIWREAPPQRRNMIEHQFKLQVVDPAKKQRDQGLNSLTSALSNFGQCFDDNISDPDAKPKWFSKYGSEIARRAEMSYAFQSP